MKMNGKKKKTKKKRKKSFIFFQIKDQNFYKPQKR